MTRKTLLSASALAFLTVAAYYPVFSAGYIWDDDFYLTENLLLNSITGLWRIWSEPAASPQYYPLVFTSFWIEKRLWGLDPLGYHLVNALLHAGCAFLLYRILLRLRMRGAILVAAVFAVHPLFVESVAWVTERKNVLSGFFCLASFLSLLKWQESGSPSNRDYVKAFVFFLLSLLSKTVTSTMPAAFLVTAWFSGKRIDRRLVTRLIPFFVAGIGLGMLTGYLEYYHVGAQGPEAQIPLVNRVLTAGWIFWFYLKKIFFPVSFCFNYPQFYPNPHELRQWLYPASAAALPFILWAFRKRLGKGPLAAVLLYGGTVFPALGFIDVYPFRYSVTADHFCYLPALFPLVLAVAALGRLPKKAFIAVSAAIIAFLGLSTFGHSSSFLNRETLYRATVRCNPGSWFAHRKLAAVFAEQGRYDEALASFGAALSARPEDADDPSREAVALTDLGFHLAYIGRNLDASGFFHRALSISPGYPRAMLNLGVNLNSMGKRKEAAGYFISALSLKPDYAAAAANLLTLKKNLEKADRASTGMTGFSLNYPETSIPLLLAALDKNPLNLPARKALALALNETGQTEKAYREGRKYCRLAEILSRSMLLVAADLEGRGRDAESKRYRMEGLLLRKDHAEGCGAP